MGDEGVAGGSGVFSGWERFFTELSVFLDTAERQISTANQAYSEYVLERLELSLETLNSVIHHLQTVTPTNDGQASIAAHYVSEISELARCVHEIASFWERHLDEVVSGRGRGQAAYSAPTESSARGRPCFVITREQLLHLASMSFTWTQIAGMLGVSRNTVFQLLWLLCLGQRLQFPIQCLSHHSRNF